jgi:hypothetical protein
MQKIIGFLIIVAGIILGLYLGLWLCLVGGIIQIIEACKATPIVSSGVAVGILRFFCTSFVIWVTIVFCSFIGGTLIATSRPKIPKRFSW